MRDGTTSEDTRVVPQQQSRSHIREVYPCPVAPKHGSSQTDHPQLPDLDPNAI
ncbi:hypothetical protein BGW80DRAFT_1303180, partial [Lactifluus volemus]